MTTTGAWGDQADAVLARVQDQVAKAEERARAATRLRSELDQVRGEARSARGEVSVACDATGRVAALRFSADAMDLAPEALSTLTLTTIEAARRKAGEIALGLAREALGEDSPAVGLIARELSTPPAGDRGAGKPGGRHA